MSNISFGNLSVNNVNVTPEMEKRIQSQENFTAIDTEKLKQDTVELTQNTVKENFIFKILRNTFGVKDPKKLLTSLGLTAITVVGFAVGGNATIKKMTKAGLKVDDVLKGNKLYNNITSAFKKGTDTIGNFFKKSKTISDVTDKLKNKMAKPIQSFAKGTGQGFKIQFAYTVPDILEALPLKAQGETYKTLKKTLGKKNALEVITKAGSAGYDKAKIFDYLKHVLKDDTKARKLADEIFDNNEKLLKNLEGLVGSAKAKEYLQKCMNADRSDVKKLVDTLTQDIAENVYGKKDISSKELSDLLIALKDGSKDFRGFDLSKFNELTMNREGFIGSWWPYNIINSIAKKFNGGKDIRFTKGSLGDALLKYNVAAGKTADTALGKVTQNLLLIPGESVSNFCCDAAGMNFFLLPMVFDLFNTAQDAPKGQKVSTVANDFVGSIGSLMITMPLASAATYGLATLKEVDGNTFISKYLLKPIGKVFGMGLDKAANDAIKKAPLKGSVLKKLGNFGARWGGGLLRFVSIMFVFQSLFSKPVQAVIQKIFGKPYDKEAAEQAKQLEAQKQQVIPELGITQGELMEKMQKNPEAIQKLQGDVKLMQAVETNPKVLLDLLDNKPVNADEILAKANAHKGKILSPANANLLKNNTNMSTGAQKVASKTPQKTQNENQNVDTATYIPSSAFVAKSSNLSPEQQSEYNALMAKSDKILKSAEKYI